MCKPYKLCKSAQINKGKLLHKHYPVFLGQRKQFFHFFRVQRHWYVTDYIFPPFQRLPYIVCSVLLGGLDINNIQPAQKTFIICTVRIQLISVTEFSCNKDIFGINTLHMEPTYKLGFHNHSVVFRIICHNSNTKNRPLTSEFGAGNILGTLQINNLTVIF